MEEEEKDRIVTKLHDILRPFLLRRLKKDVLKDMPGKLEVAWSVWHANHHVLSLSPCPSCCLSAATLKRLVTMRSSVLEDF